LAFCGEGFGASGVGGIVAQEVAVFFDVGAAAGGVGDDGVHVGVFESVDGVACVGLRLGLFAGVDEQSAAAGLRGRSDDFAAFGGEDADGGGVDVGEEGALDAAEKEADAFALRALRGSDGGDGLRGFHRGHEEFHGGELFRKEIEEAGSANERLQAGFLIEAERCAKKIHARGFGKGGEEQATMKFFGEGARVVAFDLGARGFDEFSVVDTGGTDGHASNAAEAFIEMADPGGIHLGLALGGHFH